MRSDGEERKGRSGEERAKAADRCIAEAAGGRPAAGPGGRGPWGGGRGGGGGPAKPRPGWAVPCAAAPPPPTFPAPRRAPPTPASPRSSARPRKTQRAARLRASCAEPRRRGYGSAARPEPELTGVAELPAQRPPQAAQPRPQVGTDGRRRDAGRRDLDGRAPRAAAAGPTGWAGTGDANPRTLPRAIRASQGAAALPVDAPTDLPHPPPPPPGRLGGRGEWEGEGSRAGHRNHMPFSCLGAPGTPGLVLDSAGAVEASRPSPRGQGVVGDPRVNARGTGRHFSGSGSAA